MRWLLLKDLQIMRRSPLVSALLVLYPIAVAVLIGLSLSRGPDKPRVAFLNQVPAASQLNLGGEALSQSGAREDLCERIECVDVESEAEARELVENGDVLGALILPPDLIEQIRSLTSLAPATPTVKVLVNEEDPLKAQLVDDRIKALVTEANLTLAKEVADTGANYLDLLIDGGEFNFFGISAEILGLERAGGILEALRPAIPEGPTRDALDRVITFAELARENLDIAAPLLEAIAEPIAVDKEIVSGDAPSLNAFAIAVAATVTLMFVTMLLVAGSLAVEREENTFGRLARGLASATEILLGKVALGVVIGLPVTLLMLAGLELFLSLSWERIALWLAAIALGAAAFAAFGAAIGAATKEVRASSLIAFMVALPVAFLSLVSTGTVSPGLLDMIEMIRGAFPFDPALDAISGGLDPAGPDLPAPLAHLAALALVYLLLARLALRRFA